MKIHDFKLSALPALTVLVWGSLASHLHGQVVIGAPRVTQAMAANQSAPKAGAMGSLSTIRSVLGKTGPLAQVGPAAFRPYASYSFEYGRGALRVPGEPTNSSHQTLTVGLLTEIGKSWFVDGSLSRASHSSRLLSDTYDSSLSAGGRWSLDEWKFGVNGMYATNSPIIVETGSQNREKTTRVTGTVSRAIGDRTSFEVSPAWSKRKAAPEFQTASWTGSDWIQETINAWLNYHASNKLTASIGVMAGQDDLTSSADMNYYQPQARIKWAPTERLSLSVNGGVEKRRVEGTGGKRSSNPVYDVSVGYTPTMTTTVTLTGSRNVSNSYFNNQTTEGTSVGANVSQRFLQRYFFAAGVSHGTSRYESTIVSLNTDRDDEFDSFSTSISTSFLQRGSVSLSYGYSRNSSNTSEYRYSSSQVGASVGYRF